MSGTREGGLKAAATNKQRYGMDFYKGIGHDGGVAGTGDTKGFASNHERAVEAGRRGGKASRKPRVSKELATEIALDGGRPRKAKAVPVKMVEKAVPVELAKGKYETPVAFDIPQPKPSLLSRLFRRGAR